MLRLSPGERPVRKWIREKQNRGHEGGGGIEALGWMPNCIEP